MTSAQLHCLIELKRLSEKTPDVASVRLTKALGISKPSVHRLLEVLRARGLVEKEYYGEAHLTQAGSDLADKMLERIKSLAGKLAEGIVKPEDAFEAAMVLLCGLDEEKFDCIGV